MFLGSAGDVETFPGAWLLNPWAIAALVALVVNDHLLKPAFGTWWTGKLSDVAGLIVFPLFLCATVDWLLWFRGRRLRPLGCIPLLTCLITGLCFSAINLFDFAAHLYLEALSHIQAVLRTHLIAVTFGHTKDETDLLALPALVAAWKIIRGSTTGRHEALASGAEPPQACDS